MAGNQKNQIDLSTLAPQQLDGLRQQIEGELQQLSQSLQTMQNVAKQYGLSGQAINQLKSQEPGKPLLLPLTQSLYVAGELEDPSTVLVDIGTGYYVEKKCDDGVEFCKRKVEMLTANSQELVKVMRDKQEMGGQVSKVLQMKMQAAQQQQQQEGATASA